MSINHVVTAVLRRAEESPDAPALIERDRVVTYQELVLLAEKALVELDAVDAGRGTVGLRAPKSVESVALVFALMWRGRSFVLPSHELGDVVLATLLAGAHCSVVRTVDGNYSPMTPELPPRPESAGVNFMLTTSGSTGLPKIVPLPVDAVDRFTEWAIAHFDLRPGVVVMNYSPLNFDLCLLDIWATLRGGGCVVLSDTGNATNPRYLADAVIRATVDVIQGVPMLFRMLDEAHQRDGVTYPSVRDVIVTGEAILPALLRKLPVLFPNARLSNVYGCTETNDSLIATITAADVERGELPLGTPLPGVRVELVDEDGAVVRGPGSGQLYVSTPYQTRGYLDLDLAADRFVPHPEHTDRHVYFRSGDLVRRDDDGELWLIGRTDLQVKVRGVRTNIADVEHAIAAHEEVAEAVVIAVPDDLAGKALHAQVRRRSGTALNSLALRQFVAGRLPRTAIPSTLTISDEAIPRTSTGKPDRQLLLKTKLEKG